MKNSCDCFLIYWTLIVSMKLLRKQMGEERDWAFQHRHGVDCDSDRKINLMIGIRALTSWSNPLFSFTMHLDNGNSWSIRKNSIPN